MDKCKYHGCCPAASPWCNGGEPKAECVPLLISAYNGRKAETGAAASAQLEHERWEDIVINREIAQTGKLQTIKKAEDQFRKLADVIANRNGTAEGQLFSTIAETEIALNELKTVFNCRERVNGHRVELLARLGR